MPGASDAVELKLLEHLVSRTNYPQPPNPLFLALTLALPIDSDTAATISEATYVGYARKSMLGSDWGAATIGPPTTIANINPIVFANCTGGSNLILGFALTTTAAGAGDIQAYGPCSPNITINVAASPATFPPGTLVIQFPD